MQITKKQLHFAEFIIAFSEEIGVNYFPNNN